MNTCKYKGMFIQKYVVDSRKYYRVKKHPRDSFALHHGSFDTFKEAREWINRR